MSIIIQSKRALKALIAERVQRKTIQCLTAHFIKTTCNLEIEKHKAQILIKIFIKRKI